MDGYFVPDERKGPVIERIFSMYGTGLHGYKEIAKAVRREFGLKHVANSTVQRIVTNSIYAGIRTKTWNLSTEEYLFWGASAPGEFTEVYPLAHVKPIVSQEDFERCERIRIARQR
ncbi:MAG TPA: recombinase family protein [bacterium]|nr:recombinase family protein [bacterium]